MPRLRTNNVFGTTTNNPLLIGGTTLNSAGLANLATVASPNTAVITLDPNRVNGAPEIITVTTHTAAATSATITRGQEGTAARQHPLGTFWVHAATAEDWGTDWADYTPTFTNFTLGNGTIDIASFVQVGDTVDWWVRVALGSTSTMGTSPTVTMPVAQHASYEAGSQVGLLRCLDTGTAQFRGVARHSSSAVALLQVWAAGGTHLSDTGITATVPMTWATGDKFEVVGSYRAA